MKRKFVNGLLMMALTVSSVSGFVACKDYDEDMYADMKSRIDKEASLREALQTQVDELTALVKSLENCKCDLSGYLTAEQANLDQYLTKLEAATKYMTEEEIKDYVKSMMPNTDYATKIASLEASIAVMQSAIDGINAKLGQIDINTDEIARQAGQISALNSALVAAQETANEALELAKRAGTPFDPTELISRLDQLDNLIAGWDAKLTDVSTAAENAAAKANANAALIAANRHSIDSLANVVKNIPGGDIAVDLTEVENRLKAIEEDYVKSGELDSVRSNLEAAVQQAQLLAQLAMDLATVNSGRIDEIDGCPECILSRIVALEKALKDLPDFSDLVKKVADHETRIGKLEAQCKDCIERPEFDDAINKVNARVDSLAAVTKRIEDDLYNNMITGIIVQAAESPVLGYLNTPFGLNANVLAVYYGKPTEDWEFPARLGKYYVNGSSDLNKWSQRNIEIIGALNTVEGFVSGRANQIIVTGTTNNGGVAKGNAGTLYVTVNPANVSFAGKTLKLVDSQDKNAPVTLEPLAVSDRTLNFGYTRAAGNGFYEAKATISKENVGKAEIKIDYNALQEDIKDLLKDRTKSDVMDLGATLVNNITNVLPAYGVMGSWTSTGYSAKEDKIVTTEHKIYSQYNVAATAIQPLSLAFLNDWKGVNSMPGVDRLQDLVGKIINKINIDVNLNLPDFSKYDDVQIEFGNVEVPEMADKIKVTFTLKLIGINGNDVVYIPVYNAAGKMAMVTMNEDGTIGDLYINGEKTPWENSGFSKDAVNNLISYEVEVDNDMKSTLEDVIKSLKESGQSANDTLKDLLNDIASIGNLNGTISGTIDDAKNEVKSVISGYISRINNKLTKWINRAPGMLHLTVVANAGDKVGMLSQSKYMPTAASGAVTLVPTTYNLELVAPTYKKFVAVTDVFTTDGKEVDLAAAKSLAKAANGKNMGKVIEGNSICTLNGQKGYIYEVTYTAVDYFGKVAIRKYYVKF